MILQIDKFRLKSLLLGLRGSRGFDVISQTPEGFTVSRYQVKEGQVSVSEPKPFDPVLAALQDDEIFHLVEEILPFVNLRFPDDANTEEFFKILTALYYRFPDDKKILDWLRDLHSFYEVQRDTAATLLDLEFEKDD